MKIDKYVKNLSNKLDSFSYGNNGNAPNGIIDTKDDDDYYIEIGSEPPRFAGYRAARAKKCTPPEGRKRLTMFGIALLRTNWTMA